MERGAKIYTDCGSLDDNEQNDDSMIGTGLEAPDTILADRREGKND